VVAVEEDAGMASAAAQSLQGQATVVTAALAQGAALQGPYDVILLEGGAEAFPAALEAQLKEGGRLGAIFMEGALGIARVGYKRDGKVTWRFAFNATAPVAPGFEAARGFVL
jgi:protein-L-isoaspartate(D-aspartate) O-methyltransferase